MSTIVEFGNKQYNVVDGSVIDVDFISTANPGDHVVLKHILSYKNGEMSQAKVEGKVVAHIRGEKLLSFYHKRRKHHRRVKGHIQNYTKIIVAVAA